MSLAPLKACCGVFGMSFHGLEGLQRRAQRPEKQTPPFTVCSARIFPEWLDVFLAPQLLWVYAEHVLVHGEARLWDLVGSGSATWVTSAGHKDTNASG